MKLSKIKTVIKYFLYALLMFFIIIGVISSKNRRNKNPISHKKIKTVVIDGCEYLYDYGYNDRIIAHKGSCKNH